MPTEHESTPINTLKSNLSNSNLKCTLCGGVRIHRLERNGPIEKWIYPIFGYYPWRCGTCNRKLYLRARYRRGDTPKQYVD